MLAAAGIASRRGADELVAAGRVTVDGRPAALGERVDPSGARILVDGRPIGAAPEAAVHLVLHKPAGVTSTVRDRHAERTVVELVPPGLVRGARLYPVGRLDRDSEGLILLTNDGAWAERVLHPRHGVEREYAVAVDRAPTPAEVALLARGIELEEGLATAVGVRVQTRTEDRRLGELIGPVDPRLVWVRATIGHGWKRQLRRMFAAVGLPVRRLVRVRIGPLRLDDLPPGAVRELGAAEVRRLGAGRGRPAGAGR